MTRKVFFTEGVRGLALLLLAIVERAHAANCPWSELTTVGDDGFITIHPPSLPEGFENPVSAAYEQGFRQRYNALLRSWTKGRGL